jgi:hypothetical protein
MKKRRIPDRLLRQEARCIQQRIAHYRANENLERRLTGDYSTHVASVAAKKILTPEGE